jgi:uncharacterized protein
MLSQLTIPKEKSSDPALNQETLYAIGLGHVQRLANRIWTDYNVHDPGITTLELLCYALTDLGYRAQFPVKDLLASETNNADEMKKQFFTARQILPNRALTLLDYRKLLIDLKGVKNAWLTPASLTYFADTIKGVLLKTDPGLPGIKPVEVRGLYDVRIEYMDSINAADEKAAVLKTVKERLQANRNLCENFVSFSEVSTQNFLLCAELELASDANAVQVEADIFFQVQQYLAPAVVNHTLSEMLERKHTDGTAFTVDEIFNGPALDCGFIDDEELAAADLRAEIHLSDVISIIMDIEGVRAVKDIVINPQGTSTALADKWIVPITAGKKALLNVDQSRLVIYKRNMPMTVDLAAVKASLNDLNEAARAKAETAFAYDLDIPLGQFRQPSSYYSFQNHFPVLYGLSEFGLNSAADDARKALAYQLKGYLLFFDQIMANYFAQLSHVKDLLSTDPALQRTYFCQVVDSFADSKEIYAANPLPALEAAAEDAELFADRRNRFLDHLIARFAERFTEFANIMQSALGTTEAGMIGFKCEFLKNYPGISIERSLAYNYSLKKDADLWNSPNVSGLEKRLAKLLGIRNFTRRNLGDIAYDIYAEIDATPGNEFRWRIRKKDTGKIILSSSTKYTTKKLARQEMQTAISFALLPAGYQRKEAPNGTHYFNIVDGGNNVVGRRIEYFDTIEHMEQAIAELIEYLQVNYSDEGMYLVETILLRPEQNTDPFLPICPDPNCTDCADEDPYSYRIHVILPAYASRFANMDFRRFVEEVIREETPAHILPRICWISKEDMAVLEKAYRDWIYLKAGAETAQRKTKLQAFIDILFAVRNVYPPQKLHECDAAEDESKFLLGQTALGTMKDAP